jgi:hypothetical protein
MNSFTFSSSFTLLNLIIIWVIFLFFPAVTAATSVFDYATIFVGLSILLGLPIRTLFLCVVKDVRFAPIILPIMRVNTIFSLMFLIAERAPYSLKPKDVKVSIFLHIFKIVD